MNCRMHMMTAILAVFFVGQACLHADVKLPNIIGSHMIIQREKPVRIWGWADPGEKVMVRFGQDSETDTADENGKWMVELQEQKASNEPQKMVIQGNNEIVLKNILVGEVWLCSGQSNMQWRMNQTQHGKEEIPKAKYPNIRLFQIGREVAPVPQDNVPAAWKACTPKTVRKFSAVGYHFGQNLHDKLGIPIGLVQSAWGGTEIEPWTPLEGFAQIEELASFEDEVSKLTKDSKVNQRTPSAIYNQMIHPLVPLSMRGVIWYQGESNCVKGDTTIYTDKTLAMVSSWRSVFNQDDLSFYFVQIAPYAYTKRNKTGENLTTDSLPHFWEAQTACLDKVPNCGMVVVTDITGDVRNIHPGNKRDVGHRLALWARAKNYGEQDLVYSGPMYQSMKTEGSKIVLSFEHCGSGLKSLDDGPLSQFTIAGIDRKFVPAEAEIDGNTVVVSSPDVAKPTAVRFAWHETAIGNLGNNEGLPAAPFRTDDW